jgi:hypothetical protein
MEKKFTAVVTKARAGSYEPEESSSHPNTLFP